MLNDLAVNPDALVRARAVRRVCSGALVLALLSFEDSANAEPPPAWQLGGQVAISLDHAVEPGWLLGLAVAARHPLRTWLDLQLRLYGTYRDVKWRYEPGTGSMPGVGYVGLGDGSDIHGLVEGTARWRPWGPLFGGIGPQAGIRSLPYAEIVSLSGPSYRTGTDVQPVLRGLFEVGADFGPDEMFEVGARLAVGSTLGRGPAERGRNTLDAEAGLSVGALLPL